MQVFSGFACCTTCDRIPGGNLSLHSVTLLQCYSVTQWQLGFLSRRPSRDKSGDRWETRRTSSQPQHRQDDQGSGENIVFFFPFLFLVRILSFSFLFCLYFIHVYSASLTTSTPPSSSEYFSFCPSFYLSSFFTQFLDCSEDFLHNLTSRPSMSSGQF